MIPSCSVPTPATRVRPSNTHVYFDSDDLGVTEEFLVENYTKMSIGGEGEQSHTRITRKWLGDISFDELEFSYDMSFDADPLGQVCLCRVHDGHIEDTVPGSSPDSFGPGDLALIAPPELPFSGKVCASTYDLTMFDADLLNRVATPASGRPEESVRLLGHRPVSPRAGRQLSAAIDFTRAALHADAPETSALVAATTASFLASMVVATLPTNATLDPDARDRADARPALLRKAIAFIDANAHTDIMLTDVAAAVYVTPRTLQYTFRRYLDMSPMEYLRRVRLDHAHEHLRRADPATTTVGMVATQWGFAHTGRFSALYRRTYGRTPSATLRN